MTVANKDLMGWLDRRWEYAVKFAADFTCELAGMEGRCDNKREAAHIISRGMPWTRHDVRNGVCVCRRHHSHRLIMAWLQAHHPARYEWILKEKAKIHAGQVLDLRDVEVKLRAAV